MEKELKNIARAVGNYNSVPTSITSVASVVTMVDGLSITKQADKSVWADGTLTYTIVVTNNAEETYGTPVITDTLDTSLVKFVDGSITIDSAKATSSEYEYDEGSGQLTIKLQDITSSAEKTITFEVSKASA